MSTPTKILTAILTTLYVVLIIVAFALELSALASLLLTPVVIGAIVVTAIAFDAFVTNYFFFFRIGQNYFVILGNLGDVALKYFARIKGKSFDPLTGKKEVYTATVGEEQKELDVPNQRDFYDSLFLNYLANSWDIYYKGLNTKLITPKWLTDPRIPFTEVYDFTTDECKIAGLAHNTVNKLALDQDDLSEYLRLSDKNVVTLIKGDYEASLRVHFADLGEVKAKEGEEPYNIRKILGVRTEGTTLEEGFRTTVWDILLASAKRYGRKVNNLSITDVVPANEKIRGAEEKVALAEIDKREEILKSEGKAQAITNESVAKAAAATREGLAEVAIEKGYAEGGVDRMAISVGRLSQLTQLFITTQPPQLTYAANAAGGNTQPQQPPPTTAQP